MNVLYLQDRANIGGAQLSMRDLLRALRQHAPEVKPTVVLGERGFLFDELTVLGLSPLVEPFAEFRKWTHFFKRAAFLRRLQEICQARQIQIVHGNNFQTAPWSARVARTAGLKSCCTVREAISAPVWQKYRVLENDRVIAVSQAVARNVPPDAVGKVRQVYNCVPPPPLLLARDDARQKLKLPASGLVVGYIGALSERKGLLHFLKAMPSVLAELPDVRFVLVGGGQSEFLKTVQQRLAELNLKEKVYLPGEIKDASSLLPGFDLLVLPSLMEGAPRAVIEAMHTGLAVVGTNAGGTAEIVEDRLSGTVVSPADAGALAGAIINYLKDERLRQQHGERAKQRAAELFSPEQNAKKLVAVYRELLNGH